MANRRVIDRRACGRALALAIVLPMAVLLLGQSSTVVRMADRVLDTCGTSLLNCGFEAGTTDGWTFLANGSGTARVVGAPVHSGHYAVQLAGAGELYQTILVPGPG